MREPNESRCWERKLFELAADRRKKARYLYLLEDDRKRKKLLEALNHSLDLDPRRASPIPSQEREQGRLVELLRSNGAGQSCLFVAYQSERDGQWMDLEEGVQVFLDHFWGSLLIGPPKPVAIYKEEGTGRMLLVSPRS